MNRFFNFFAACVFLLSHTCQTNAGDLFENQRCKEYRPFGYIFGYAGPGIESERDGEHDFAIFSDVPGAFDVDGGIHYGAGAGIYTDLFGHPIRD